MKKALIVLLVLGVAGGLFAQDITWSGSLGTGVFFKFGDSNDPAIVVADDDDDGTPIIAKLNAAYDAGDWGLKLGSVGRAGDGLNLSLYNAYGWMNFLGGMLNVKAGKIDDGVWSTGGWIDKGYATGGGVRLEVKPIDGLNVGAFLSFPNGGFKASEIPFFFQETAIGFSYDSSLFGVSATFKLHSEECVADSLNKEDWGGADAGKGAYNGPATGDMSAVLTAGVNITAIDIVGIYLGFHFDHLIGDPDIEMTFGQDFTFNVMDGLGLSLRLGEVLCDGLKLFHVKPEVTFGVTDAIQVGLNVPVFMRENEAEDFGLASIGANLWGKYTIGGSWVKAGYGFTMKTEDYGDALDHYVKFIFGYSF